MELISGIAVIRELPAVYIRNSKTAIIADTHIGFEEEMAEKGIFIPRFQLRKVLDILEQVIDEVNPETLIIAGDFKHKFDGLGRVERRELSEVLMFALRKINKIIIVRGNHDNYLPLLRDKYQFDIVNELKLGEILIVHGHKPITEKGTDWKVVIFGHEHPSIAVRDSLGTVGKFPCFLMGELKDGRKLITLPAVGAYQTGSKVTTARDTYLSPILRDEAIIEKLKPIIVDEEIGLFELPTLSELMDLI